MPSDSAILTTVHDRLGSLFNLMPGPSPDDTPRTVNAWKKLFKLFTGFSVDIVRQHPDFIDFFEGVQEPNNTQEDVAMSDEDVDGGEHDDAGKDDLEMEEEESATRGASGNEEQEERKETPEERKERRRLEAHRIVLKRAQQIVGAVAKGPVQARELVLRIISPPAVVAEKAEDIALACLLRGYENPGSWGVILREHTLGAAPTNVEFCKVSRQLDEAPDLMKRDINLSHTESSTSLDTYLSDIIHKIEAIKFGAEWEKKTGPGSGAFKANYNKRLYQRENETIFRNLAPREKEAKMEEHAANFELFKQAREPLITARNRLLFAYRSFGCGIIIDPFFAVSNLGHKRAKKFKSLLDVLINLAPPSSDEDAVGRTQLDDNEESNRDVLYRLTSKLCRDTEEQDSIAEYLDNFFIDYPSKVRI